MLLREMRETPLHPKVHLFVCSNRRAPGDPLGEGCGDAGDAVFAAMKHEVAARGAFRAIWVTRTHCLGICPKHGCTVAVYPKGRIVAEVGASEAASLFAKALEEA